MTPRNFKPKSGFSVYYDALRTAIAAPIRLWSTTDCMDKGNYEDDLSVAVLYNLYFVTC